jgi:DNA-directed DNA polymerase III (polc)
MNFAHLHVYSEFSLLNSTCRVEQLAARAVKEGQTALALTDRNVMYGVIPFYNACKKAGIHPLIGMELSVSGSSAGQERDTREGPTGSLVLLAEDQEGYVHLVGLASLVQLRQEHRIDLGTLADHAGGLIALSGGGDGLIDQLISDGNSGGAEQAAKTLKTIFPGRFYLELQRRGSARGSQTEQGKRALSKALSLPLVATSSIHYLETGEAQAYACLRCIEKGTKLKDEQAAESHDSDFKSTDEMERRFSDLPEALANSVKIAGQCHVDFSFGRMRLPAFPVPVGKTSAQVLREACERGLKNKYPVITDEARTRLEKELAIIGQMGFDDYFLIVSDLIDHARKSGYTPGPGRGSAAGSLVAYILNITEVDPLKYHLLFERFLNPERVTMPDIDMDFPDVDRDKMILYASRKYGTDHVAQIITFGTLAAKAAVRDAGRAMDSDPRLPDKMARLIPSLPKMTLKKALSESPKLRTMLQTSADAAELFRLAGQIEGLPRHSSIHAAGVVFSDRPLTESVPLQEGHEGIPVTQYPMDVLESLGMLKIDFLGLRNLTFLREVIRRVSIFSGKPLSAETIPGQDPETFDMLGRGETTGIFQLESDGMRQVLRQLKPTDFEDIVAVISLYRPGPVQFIGRYISRKHGKETVTYPHPDLEKILAPTYGVLVYQEQIMQIAVKMAGYSLGQADILRRAVSKKKRSMLEDQKKDFLSGSARNGYSPEVAESIFDLIVRFANYGFNRSHAVAYGMVSYRLAYLKAHYPQVFMACHLSSISGNDEKVNAALQEIRRLDIDLFPPSVNKSVKTFEPENNGIRFGLSAIKNLGDGAIEELIQQRRSDGVFRSLFNFCRRVSLRKINRKAIESMIFAGAMDDFGTDRAVLLATLDRAIRTGEEDQKSADGQESLNLAGTDEEHYIDVPPLTIREKLHYEREILGVYLSAHPLERFRKYLPPGFPRITGFSSVAAVGNRALPLAVMIEDVKVIQTKSGKPMAFLSVSDESGTAEAVCFPECYSRIQSGLREGRLLIAQANVSEKKGKDRIQLVIDQAIPLEGYLKRKRAVVFLQIDRSHQQEDILDQVKKELLACPGHHRVVIHYAQSGKTLALAQKYTASINEPFIARMRKYLGNENVTVRTGRNKS